MSEHQKLAVQLEGEYYAKTHSVGISIAGYHITTVPVVDSDAESPEVVDNVITLAVVDWLRRLDQGARTAERLDGISEHMKDAWRQR
jgi:hypothetical protein